MSQAGKSVDPPLHATLRAWLWDLFQVVVGGNEKKKAAIRAAIPNPGRILEIGCATGNVASVFSDVEYVGVDIDAGCIARTRRKFPQPNYRFHCLDLLEQEFPGGTTFDTVLLSQCAHHLSDASMRGILRRSAALVRGGGEFVIFDLIRPEPGDPFNKQFYFKLDRGEHIRNEQELLELFHSSDGFHEPEAEILKAHKFGIEVMDLVMLRARRRSFE